MKHKHKIALTLLYLLIIILFTFYFTVYLDLTPEQRDKDMFGKAINWMLGVDLAGKGGSIVAQVKPSFVLDPSYSSFIHQQLPSQKAVLLIQQYTLLNKFKQFSDPFKEFVTYITTSSGETTAQSFINYYTKDTWVEQQNAIRLALAGKATSFLNKDLVGLGGGAVTYPQISGKVYMKYVAAQEDEYHIIAQVKKPTTLLLDSLLISTQGYKLIGAEGYILEAKFYCNNEICYADFKVPSSAKQCYPYYINIKTGNGVQLFTTPITLNSNNHYYFSSPDWSNPTIKDPYDPSVGNVECKNSILTPLNQVSSSSVSGKAYLTYDKTTPKYLYLNVEFSHTFPSDSIPYLKVKTFGSAENQFLGVAITCNNGVCKPLSNKVKIPGLNWCLPVEIILELSEKDDDLIKAYNVELNGNNNYFYSSTDWNDETKTDPYDPTLSNVQCDNGKIIVTNQIDGGAVTYPQINGKVYITSLNGDYYFNAEILSTNKELAYLYLNPLALLEQGAYYLNTDYILDCQGKLCNHLSKKIINPNSVCSGEIQFWLTYLDETGNEKAVFMPLTLPTNKLYFSSTNWYLDKVGIDDPISNVYCENGQLKVTGQPPVVGESCTNQLPYFTDPETGLTTFKPFEEKGNNQEYRYVGQSVTLCHGTYEFDKPFVFISKEKGKELVLNCQGSTLKYAPNTYFTTPFITSLDHEENIVIKNCKFEGFNTVFGAAHGKNIAFLNNEFTNVATVAQFDFGDGIIFDSNTITSLKYTAPDEKITPQAGNLFFNNVNFVSLSNNYFQISGTLKLDQGNNHIINDNDFMGGYYEFINSDDLLLSDNTFISVKIPSPTDGMLVEEVSNVITSKNNFALPQVKFSGLQKPVFFGNTYESIKQPLFSEISEAMIYNENVMTDPLYFEENPLANYFISIPENKIELHDSSYGAFYYTFDPIIVHTNMAPAYFSTITMNDKTDNVYTDYIAPDKNNKKIYFGFAKVGTAQIKPLPQYNVKVVHNGKETNYYQNRLLEEDSQTIYKVQDMCFQNPAVYDVYYKYFDYNTQKYIDVISPKKEQYSGAIDSLKGTKLVCKGGTYTPTVDVCSKHSDCDAGKACQKGLCVLKTNFVCEDTDLGTQQENQGLSVEQYKYVNQFKFGVATGMNLNENKGFGSYKDFCFNDNLFEYSCVNVNLPTLQKNEVTYININCEHGCKEGYCKKSCAQDTDCPAGFSCKGDANKFCELNKCTDTSQCQEGEVCYTLLGACLPIPEQCQYDSECLNDDYVCSLGKGCILKDSLGATTSECDQAADCDDGFYCQPQYQAGSFVGGTCLALPDECTTSDQCPEFYTCEDTICVLEDDACLSDNDCAAEELCDEGSCINKQAFVCTDTDVGPVVFDVSYYNLGVPGIVKGYSPSLNAVDSASDYCVDNNHGVMEFMCDNKANTITGKISECKNDCIDGYCKQPCSAAQPCPQGFTCTTEGTESYCKSESPINNLACTTNEQCPFPAVCENNKCVVPDEIPECTKDAHCTSGEKCQGGDCVTDIGDLGDKKQCNKDSDCQNGFYCPQYGDLLVLPLCTPLPTGCADDASCKSSNFYCASDKTCKPLAAKSCSTTADCKNVKYECKSNVCTLKTDKLPTGELYYYTTSDGKPVLNVSVGDADGVKAVLLYYDLSKQEITSELKESKLLIGCFGANVEACKKETNSFTFAVKEGVSAVCSQSCSKAITGVIIEDNAGNQYQYYLNKDNDFYVNLVNDKIKSVVAGHPGVCSCGSLPANYCYTKDANDKQGTCKYSYEFCDVAEKVPICKLKLETCNKDSPFNFCGSGNVCTGSICMVDCSGVKKCPEGLTCAANVCIKSGETCVDNNQCASGECKNNVCQIISPAADDDDDDNDYKPNKKKKKKYLDCEPKYTQSCYNEAKKQKCINGMQTTKCKPLNNCYSDGGILQITCGTPDPTYGTTKPTCNDGIKNQDEKGVDCGGSCSKLCKPLTIGGGTVPQSTYTPPQSKPPYTPPEFKQATCYDGIQNQGESGLDCGGPCNACESCFDEIQNQDEEGIDCGGSCEACSSPWKKWLYILVPVVLVIGLLLMLLVKAVKPGKGNHGGFSNHNTGIDLRTTHMGGLHGFEQHSPESKFSHQHPSPKPFTDIPSVHTSGQGFESQLQHYIELELQKGYTREHIIKNLTSVGWPQDKVEQMFNQEAHTFLPTKYQQQLKHYVAFYKNKGLSLEEIEKKLIETGWNKKTIQEFLR